MLLLINISKSFKCGFNEIKKPKPIKMEADNIKPNPNRRRLSSGLKIYIDYEVLETQVSDQLSSFKASFDLAVNAFEKYLSISGANTYQFSAKEIDNAQLGFSSSQVPKLIYNSKTWDADVILVPLIDSSLGYSVDAAAYPAFLDHKTFRPILGVILLGTNYNFTRRNSQRFMGMLLLHEISHILGFNNNLFDYFIGVSNPTFTAIINGVTRTLLRTPKVLYYARKHFGCPSLSGVELENQGGSGSAGSHWEARIMLGDI